MFTGLVEEVGKVKTNVRTYDGARLEVEAKKVIEDTKLGDSVAVNGVCLTVVDIKENSLTFDISNETLKRSNLGFLKPADPVNLERALKVSDRLGGHIVQGNVDTVAKLIYKEKRGDHYTFKFQIERQFLPLVIEKGSIAIDGISLTINYIDDEVISINVIPHTYENTNLKFRQVGDTVNVEFDILGKYIVKALTKLDLSQISREKKLIELLENF